MSGFVDLLGFAASNGVTHHNQIELPPLQRCQRLIASRALHFRTGRAQQVHTGLEQLDVLSDAKNGEHGIFSILRPQPPIRARSGFRGRAGIVNKIDPAPDSVCPLLHITQAYPANRRAELVLQIIPPWLTAYLRVWASYVYYRTQQAGREVILPAEASRLACGGASSSFEMPRSWHPLQLSGGCTP
jgi:hypothetical protein